MTTPSARAAALEGLATNGPAQAYTMGYEAGQRDAATTHRLCGRGIRFEGQSPLTCNSSPTEQADPLAMLQAAAQALQHFNWHNYGLDQVADADPAWTIDAAEAVLDAAIAASRTESEEHAR